nr:NahK/ErcS family hybrid sensor histidine kinase/response regulator [Rhizobium halophytocola]
MLFAVASYGDRKSRKRGAPDKGRPFVYALSLAVYCTSWTYFGGVGLAAERGLEFTGIYIGPILMFTLGLPLVRRIIALAKSEKLTSGADFLAARYGKNPVVGLLVTLICLFGTIPYIALQLKAVSSSVSTLVDPAHYGIGTGNLYFLDLPLIVAVSLACFAIVFGTRHTDATEHQDGLILAISMESLVKLVAFWTLGLFVVFGLFDGPSDLWQRATASPEVMQALAYQTPIGRWLTLIGLSAFAIIMLPRQFHVSVVENRTAGELKLARLLFPLYLVAINIFVLPVAIAGILNYAGTVDGDLYVLAVPLEQHAPLVTLITFLGGLSAATAMVIVASVALAIMISNDIVLPFFLRHKLLVRSGQRADFARPLLQIRRSAIFVVMLLSYAYYRTADNSTGLASIGLLSFTAIAQIAPPLLGGLVWRGANARGAIIGLTVGLFGWAYLLFLPSFGGEDNAALTGAILSFLLPGTGFGDGPSADPFVNATLLSLLANTVAFVLGSLSRNPRPVERLQAGIFVKRHSRSQFATRGWKTRVNVGDLKAAIARYLGEERMQRSFLTYEQASGRRLSDDGPADMAFIHFSEQLLGSAIGSSSARLVLSIILQRAEDTSADTAWLLDQASDALQYNQGIMQSALSQMDQGIAVFDGNNCLTIWNRRFRELLDLPEQLGRVGVPLADIVDILEARGDMPPQGKPAKVTKSRPEDFLRVDRVFRMQMRGGRRILEVRSNAMPDDAVVATFTDVTSEVAADQALKQANETLEQRVEERTGELVRVNRELAEAQAAAEEANLGKTRFFAAAGHDILQPLNAARLYASALVERMDRTDNSMMVRNIDSALESVESILGAVLDISRLDTGAMKPHLTSVPLQPLFSRIETDFAPMAREKNLKLVVMPTSLTVTSDPNLLRRLVQNLVSNAIKYTPSGRVLIGARRRGDQVMIRVMDSGIGIPSTKFRTVFKEFARLDEGMKTAAGLGLGLSIVDRIARVLDHPVKLASATGRGTSFEVQVPRDLAGTKTVSAASVLAAERGLSAFRDFHVLCIDNEPQIIEGMTLLISGWGCTVTSAGSIDALDTLIAEHRKPPDLIIADYHLGEGSGIDAVVKLRAAYGADIAALLITADRTQDLRAEAERHDIGVQHKPVRPAALRAYMSRIVGTKRSAAE